jgi:hypothetical protein
MIAILIFQSTRIAEPCMDIAAGQKATRPLTLTATHVKTFVELTDDYNLLHAEDCRFIPPSR